MTPSDEHPQVDGTFGATDETVLPMEHGDVRVLRDGPLDAPVLLLVHGSAASSRSWDALTPLLCTHHRVIRVDLPGHGGSAEPPGGDYTLPEQGRRIGAVLDRLGVEHVVAVGHSSGGYAVTALAEQRPDLVTALVLINTGPGLDAFIAPERPPFSPEQWPPTDEQIRVFARTGFREGFRVPQELVDELRGMSFHAVAAAMQAATDYLRLQPLPDRLTALGRPLHVIFGELDRRWRPSSAADYRVVPGARVDFLPDAGHTPILEEPQRTAALLLASTGTPTAEAPQGT
ncbi:alpha/beta fold hydrolase [Streptomyces sp. p1417]|uniref:Alpha/beta fold hydrolase n=1 Tax=Streptomyces typhae TaxID=2681492 RepID=A0A6L6WTC6_9ACTN|nr:alpha/beta hydrolase [Streptomyces typhae]MVO85420.1 alpha/beta fold hydrolase [Streptomyces typhae]